MENKISKIEVIGSGCANCVKLHELAVKAVQEMGLDIEVVYDNDIQKALSLGVMQMPVLLADGKPLLAGSVFDIKKIKKAIEDATDDPGSCSCNGGCGGGCGCGC